MIAMAATAKHIDLSSMEEGSIILVLTSAEKYLGNVIDILKTLINKQNHSCVYVTINKPYDVLLNVLKKNGVDTENIFFIDLISKMTRTETAKLKDCLFITSPDSLTELSIAITESATNLHGKKKFIFLDSLSTMLIYNQTGTVAKFAHFLIGKLKNEETEMIIISLEKEMDPILVSQISSFVDNVIKVNGK
jgi:KaiC/GvpD/RAD55 family RecA-like ATPase